MTDVPKQVSVQELESEFGLEGNTPAAESDAVADVASGEMDVADVDVETGESKRTVESQTIERTIEREQAVADLDDNVLIMEKQAELDAEDAAVADADTEADDDEAGEDVEEEELEVEQEEEEEAEDADEEEEADADEEEAEESEEGEDADVELTPMRSWLKENVPEDEDRAELMNALLEEGVEIAYTAGGQEVKESMATILRKAAGYAGEEEVTRRSQAAKAQLTQAEALQARAQQAEERAQETVQSVTSQIDDPEAFGQFLTSRGSLEYLQQLHTQIDQTLQEAEANPQAFQMNRRLAGIEGALEQLLGGGESAGDTQDGGDAAGRQDTDEGTALDPSRIPQDLGFIKGEGYPSQFAVIAKRETLAILQAATAAGAEVTYDQVVQRWSKEGKQRSIQDVATGLIKGAVRDGQKLSKAKRPPLKKTPKGRGRSGKKKPSGSSSSKPVSWDSIPNQVVKELQRAQAGSELKS